MTPAQIATLLLAIWWSNLLVYAVPSGNHTCTGITKIPVTVLVNVTVPVTFRSYTWCLRVPPRCSKYTTQLRDRIQIHTEMHNKTITVCCRGFVEMEGRCVPACPEGADCPFMRCNRTNHCQCTPGYTGLYCNDPCPRGVWGKDCKRPCDCPTGYTCHHLTGDCFVDDRPARKTTTTTTTTTPRPTTTTDSPFTTQATTLETVKTPVFRFPPPPWVDAPSTPPKKLTTRVIRDELTSSTTINKLVETSIPTFTIPSTMTTVKTVRPPIIKFLPPPTTTYSTQSNIVKSSLEYSHSRPLQTTMVAIGSSTASIPKTDPALLPINTLENIETKPETSTIQTTVSETTNTRSVSPSSRTPSATESTYLNNEIISATPITILNHTLVQTSPLLQQSTISIADTTKIIPLKEVVEEKTTVIPEFKVIKVIKTEQSTSKVNKLPNLKNQTPPLLLTTNQHSKTQAPDVIPISIEPAVPNIKTTLLQSSQIKTKKEGSPIIYISPTFKEKTSDIGTSLSPSPKITLKPVIDIFTSPIDLISNEKTWQTADTKVITKEVTTFDDKLYFRPKTTSVEITPPVFTTNSTLLYNPITHENTRKHTDLVQNITTIPEKQEKRLEISPKSNEKNKTTTKIIEDNVQEITTQMTKKRSKDLVTKKFEEKVLKKIITHRTTSTLSPIHVLKQLLNVTSKPKHLSSTQEPLEIDVEENQASVPDLQVEEKDDYDYKKSKFDDLAVLSSDKGKKNQEKIKQSRHFKEFKESKLEKQAKIPIPPVAITTVTSETETLHKNIIQDNENLKHNSTKIHFKEENANNLSIDKPKDLDMETTHLPNNIWAALDPQINVPSITTSLKEVLPEKENKQFFEKSVVDTVTDANSVVESNTIDTIHTPYNVEAIKDILHQVEDSNYSLINNKMRLVKTETQYSESSYTGYTAMMVTLGISTITLIALTATLWLYLKRRKQRPVMRPCIMAYELSEPPPIDIQNFEHTFFCPTFTNNYAEKINRELRELSYDHPRCSQPEPLYAEIHY